AAACVSSLRRRVRAQAGGRGMPGRLADFPLDLQIRPANTVNPNSYTRSRILRKGDRALYRTTPRAKSDEHYVAPPHWPWLTQASIADHITDSYGECDPGPPDWRIGHMHAREQTATLRASKGNIMNGSIAVGRGWANLPHPVVKVTSISTERHARFPTARRDRINSAVHIRWELRRASVALRAISATAASRCVRCAAAA